MSLGKRPNKQRAEAMRLSVKAAEDKSGDPARIAAIWNDLRWKLKTSAGTYGDVDKIVLDALIRAKTEVLSSHWRDPVVKRLEEMRARLSEFTVEEEGLGELVFCANCGQEILPGEYRKDRSGQIEAYLCAKCAAIPGLE